jgi:DNA-binding CsgD family transcriptional regulator
MIDKGYYDYLQYSIEHYQHVMSDCAELKREYVRELRVTHSVKEIARALGISTARVYAIMAGN